MAHKIPTRIYLFEEEMPRHWDNLRAVMRDRPGSILHPGTLKPVTAAGGGTFGGVLKPRSNLAYTNSTGSVKTCGPINRGIK
jgi:hypothetical protein